MLFKKYLKGLQFLCALILLLITGVALIGFLEFWFEVALGIKEFVDYTDEWKMIGITVMDILLVPFFFIWLIRLSKDT